MINTSIHGITGIEVMAIKENQCDGETYYTQSLEIGTERNGYIKIDLYAETAEALILAADVADWRTQAAEESARADAAESELARLHQAIDRIAQGVQS